MTSLAFLSAQPKKDRMAHLAFTRPFGEFNFAHKLRNKPRGCVLLLHLLIERPLVRARRLHRLQRCLVEAGADVPRIDPALIRFVAYRKHQRSKVLARFVRRASPASVSGRGRFIVEVSCLAWIKKFT